MSRSSIYDRMELLRDNEVKVEVMCTKPDNSIETVDVMYLLNELYEFYLVTLDDGK